MSRSAGALGLLLSCGAALGCGPDLGECNQVWAETVVYRAGVPYYEGQALVEAHCAGSFCHTANASGVQRFGVPAELDFDVTTVTAPTPDAVAVLDRGVDRVREWAEDMWAQVDGGTMPPGAVGERDVGMWVHARADGSVPQGCPNELFGIGSPQGRSTLRNWLACGAPVVAATQDACTALPELGTIGTCRPSGQGVPSGEDVFQQIVVGQRCVSGCHEPGGLQFADHQLDLSGTAAQAYVAVVGVPAAGSNCVGSDPMTGMPNTLIVPFDCQASILYRKLAANTAGLQTCGAPMPLGRTQPFPEEQLSLLCAWIDAGAPMTPSAPAPATCGM